MLLRLTVTCGGELNGFKLHLGELVCVAAPPTALHVYLFLIYFEFFVFLSDYLI